MDKDLYGAGMRWTEPGGWKGGRIVVDVDARIQGTRRAEKGAIQARSFPLARGSRRLGEEMARQMFADDRTFRVDADFRMVPDADNVTVEFAQQGIIISGGTIQRYIPIPRTEILIWRKVEVADCVARISIPTAGLGHRWRAIVMW